jgi:class 3 adenylate cyclase
MQPCALRTKSHFFIRWLAVAALFLLPFGLAAAASAAPAPWVLRADEVGAVFPHAEALFDSTLTVDLAAVQTPAIAQRFTPLRQTSYNKRPVPGALWVRFAVQNPGTTPLQRLLFIDNRSIDELDVWMQEPDGSWTHYCSSQSVPIAARILPTMTPIFPLTVAAGTTRQVVMRFNAEIMTASAELLTLAEIMARERLRHLVCGMLLGLVLLVTAYSAYLYLRLREGLNAWLTVTGVGMLLFIAFYVWGDAYSWFPEKLAAYIELRAVFMGIFLTAIGLSGFLQQILVLRTTAPRIARYNALLHLYCWTSLGLSFLVSGYIGSTLAEIAVAGMLVPVGTACWRSLRLNRQGRLIAVAMLVVLATSAWPIVTSRGWMNANRMTPYAPAVGFTVFMVMLAAGAGHRLEYQRRKREQAIADRLAEAEKNEALSKTFERYVPQEFLSCLDKTSILEIQRGDHVQRQMSVLFSDIRSFTTLVEGHSHDENFSFINRYFARMEPAIRTAGGFVDSYEGDAMMALFPGKQVSIADDAVAAGVGMLKELAAFNRERAAEGRPPVSIGVGVNTGELILGTIGSAERMKCGVIGDPVNVAARVEGITKLYGAAMLITESTQALLSQPVELREVDRVIVKGKLTAVTVYEVLDCLPEDDRAARIRTRPLFAQGLELFRRGALDKALGCFTTIVTSTPGDAAARLYVDRCQRFLSEGLPRDWNGVMTLQTK